MESDLSEFSRSNATSRSRREFGMAGVTVVSFGIGIDLLWLSWAPPAGLPVFWTWFAVALIAAAAVTANQLEGIRAAIGTWRLTMSATLFVTVSVGYWLVFPGAGLGLLVFPIGLGMAVWLLSVITRIAINIRRRRIDATIAFAMTAISIPLLLVIGFDPGRSLRLSMVQDQYERAIADGAEGVGNAAGISNGELAAWVWVDGHNAAVSGVVYSVSGRLEDDDVDTMMEDLGYSIDSRVSCHQLRPNWFWCDF